MMTRRNNGDRNELRKSYRASVLAEIQTTLTKKYPGARVIMHRENEDGDIELEVTIPIQYVELKKH